MDTLKKIFPLSFCAYDVSKLILMCLIYVVAGTVSGFIIGLLARIPFLGMIFGLAASLVEIYVGFGLIILFLAYFKVIK